MRGNWRTTGIEAHYYCIVTLAKNCILALVPVVFQKGGDLISADVRCLPVPHGTLHPDICGIGSSHTGSAVPNMAWNVTTGQLATAEVFPKFRMLWSQREPFHVTSRIIPCP